MNEIWKTFIFNGYPNAGHVSRVLGRNVKIPINLSYMVTNGSLNEYLKNSKHIFLNNS